MIGNPLALIGLLAVAVPIIIHLLGRHQSRRKRFPTLRFISASRLAPARRRRLSDIPLLLVRCAIVAAAALALSQPWFVIAGRVPDGPAGGGISRAIIVDTSASMRRPMADGRAAVDSALAAAGTLQSDGETTVIRSDNLGDTIRGGAAWLSTRPGQRELAVISDFQSSAFDSLDLGAVPTGMGIDIVMIPAIGAVSFPAFAGIDVVAAPGQDASVAAAWTAAGYPVPTDTTARVKVIYGGITAAASSQPDEAWMGRLLADIQRDPVLQEATASATPASTTTTPPRVIARNRAGLPVIGAGRQGDDLLLLVSTDPGSLTSVALARSIARLMGGEAAGPELDSTRVSDATLASWRRDAQPATDTTSQPSDGRWLWAMALMLIGLESWMRSRRRTTTAIPAGVTIRDDTVGDRAA
jgi:hypothetical protein